MLTQNILVTLCNKDPPECGEGRQLNQQISRLKLNICLGLQLCEHLSERMDLKNKQTKKTKLRKTDGSHTPYDILIQGNIIIMIICTKAKCNNLCNCNNSDRFPH